MGPEVHAVIRTSAGESVPPGEPPRAASGGTRRRVLAALYRRPKVQLLLLLTPPAGWFGVVYLGSLALLLVTAFWTFDGVTGKVLQHWTFNNFGQLIGVKGAGPRGHRTFQGQVRFSF